MGGTLARRPWSLRAGLLLAGGEEFARGKHGCRGVPFARDALAGSFLVSYVRTRAGERGSEVAEGLATRPERVLVLGVGLLTGWVRVALWILAIATALTAIQRLVLAIGALRRAQSTEGGD